MNVANEIRNTQVELGAVVIFSLAQAGFAIKTGTGKTIVIDPYLSDCVGRMFGFKRMIPFVVSPEELQPDIMLITHSHADHLDVDALPTIAKDSRCLFVAACDCGEGLTDCGVADDRVTLLAEGEEISLDGVTIHATYADHGDLAPKAVGFVIEIDGIRIYNVGDSGPAYEKIAASVHGPVDVMIAPINGAFGNLEAAQAVELARILKPKLVIASHFWMFIEHGGNPAAFLEEAKSLAGKTQAIVMAPGESIIFGGMSER